jgi:hypothetical protein
MTKRHADNETVADIVRLRKENEELQQRIRYQEHRDGVAKGKTHSIDCYDYGPSHYECSLQEIERLREVLQKIADIEHEDIPEPATPNEANVWTILAMTIGLAEKALKKGE